MKHVVLKPFGWYPDGYSRETLVPGDERDFGSNADAMKAEGMVDEITPTQAVLPVEAPIAAGEAEIVLAATADAEELDLATAEPTHRAIRKRR